MQKETNSEGSLVNQEEEVNIKFVLKFVKSQDKCCDLTSFSLCTWLSDAESWVNQDVNTEYVNLRTNSKEILETSWVF